MRETLTFKSEIQVLCLEDNPDDVELMKEKLNSEGYTVHFDLVATENNFIDMLETNNYDLILADFSLPGFDGFTALSWASKIRPEIPFICVSGVIKEDIAIELLKQGASDYVLKDRLDKLSIAIRRSLNKVQELNALREAEKELRKLTQAVYQSPVSIFITDIHGNIEYANPRALEVTGCSKDELIGKSLQIFNAGQLTREEFMSLKETIRSGKVWQGESLNKSKDNELIWESSLVSPILDENRNIINYLIISEDVTERKQLTLDLIAAKEKAEESDRLKMSFLTNISHEIRTPMNGILGFANLLKRPGLSGKKQQEYIHIIERSGNRMLNIINDIINISKIEAGQEELQYGNIHINHLLKDLYDFFKHESKNIELKYQQGLLDEEGYIKTDPTKLNQILTNLIKNAFKFTESGTIRYWYTTKDQMLEFYVEDTGIGISPEQKEIIFERFRQADTMYTQNYEGTGLGLSISKAYVEMLGGKMWVESELGKGTTFSFNIPYIKVRNELETTGESGTRDVLRPVKILVVDGEHNNRQYFNDLLKNNKITLSFAKDGKEAIDLVKLGVDIDIVLMDVKMPFMDGYEATRQIKQIRPDLPVFAQTDHVFSSDKKKAGLSGCDEYITKPVNTGLLFNLINKYLVR